MKIKIIIEGDMYELQLKAESDDERAIIKMLTSKEKAEILIDDTEKCETISFIIARGPKK